MPIKVDRKKHSSALVLSVRGTLDYTTSTPLERELMMHIQRGETHIILDLDGVDYISSAGLRVIIKVVKELKRANGNLALCSMKDYIREVFNVSGFDSFIQIFATLDDSLRAD